MTDINGCVQNTTITLTEPTILTQTITSPLFPSGDNISCFGFNDGGIDYVPAGGSPIYTYTWTTLDGSGLTPGIEDQTNLTAGTYDISMVDINGCIQNTTIVLIQPTPLTQTITAGIFPSGDNISCFGENDGSITYGPGGGSPIYTYAWTSIDGSGLTGGAQNQSNLTSGTYDVQIVDINGCLLDTTIILIEPTPLAQSGVSFTYPSGTNISCFGEDDGSIDMTILGGSPLPDYTYNWTVVTPGSIPAGQNTLVDPSGLTAGTYGLLVTDINGCTIDTTITLIEPPVLNISAVLSVYAGGYNLSGCAPDGWIDLSVGGGNGGYNYSWSNTDIIEDIANLPAGPYDVIVTDMNGCQIALDTLLTQPLLITTTTAVTSNYNGEDISCTGVSDGAVTVNIVGGTPLFTFEWINSAGTVVSNVQSPSGLPAGVYTVDLIDLNGCTATNTVTLVDPAPFVYDVIVSTDYNGQDISCFGFSDGGIDLTVSGGTPGYTYNWTNSSGASISLVEDPSNLPAGPYDVLVTDVNGCVFDTTITLVEPDLLVGPATVTSDYNGQDVSCFQSTNGSITVDPTGGTPGYTYTWSIGGVSIGTGQDQINVGAGTYDVEVIDVNGCIHTTNVLVTQPTLVTSGTTIISNYFGQAVSCEGATDGIVDASSAGGTPGYTYSWNSIPVQTTLQATNLGVGTYTVTVTDLNGCISNSEVVLTANPMPEIVLPPNIYGCMGNGVLLDSQAEPGSSCTWTFSDGQVFNECGPFVANFANQDCYDMQLTVISALGCISAASVNDFVCIMPNPLADFYPSEYDLTNIENGTNFWNTSTGADSYIWNFGDGSPEETGENPFHEFLLGDDFATTDYAVTLYAISEYGCTDTVVKYIKLSPEVIVYVPNTFTPDDDAHNPVFLPVFTAGYDLDSYTLLIFNRWGEIVFESHNTQVGWDGSYGENNEISIVQDGTYTWKIEFKQSFNDKKVMMVGHVNVLR
jgi:gliding motility-associated-like protein